MKRLGFLLCVTLLVIVALGELAHDHAKGALEHSVTCSSCHLAIASVVTPAAAVIDAAPAPQRFSWDDPRLALPAGAPLDRPAARGPPAC